ncbi:MAG TPA: diacylglycerol kinase [Lacipirellula sp.]
MPAVDEFDDDRPRPLRTWVRMFRDAMRGVKIAVRGEVNFFVHFFIAVVAGVAGGIVELTNDQWCLFILCVTVVLTAELFNTAIEHLARAVTREQHLEIRDALDIASGAVLMASLGAACAGTLLISWPFIDKMLDATR